MNEITEILVRIEQGDELAADELLPLVYDELRRLAARKMARESPGQTIQATALVHESYLRLVGAGPNRKWKGRIHFYAAAARAMRQILVERARQKQAKKHGGGHRRVALTEQALSIDEQTVELDDALCALERHCPQAAELVQLRYFAGLAHKEAAASLGLSRRQADRLWRLARAWLCRQMMDADPR